ncbi:hypothetical protein BAE44_0013158, partial [Dichanthelium oligosanthes]
LTECGLDSRDIANLSLSSPRMVTTNLKLVREMVESAEAVGVKFEMSGQYERFGVISLSEEKIAAKLSKDRLCRMSEFLITQFGLELEYIAHRPTLLTYSLERRLVPRHYLVKFLRASAFLKPPIGEALKENGLLKRGRSYYYAINVGENVFIKKFRSPYKEAAPSLAQDYAATCKGEVPTTFRCHGLSTGLANV